MFFAGEPEQKLLAPKKVQFENKVIRCEEPKQTFTLTVLIPLIAPLFYTSTHSKKV